MLETARGGIVLRGMGYESNDASILTNVSSDHLDLQGIHTLPELAEVKATVCRITKPDGWVVLNGDDPLVAAVARRVQRERGVLLDGAQRPGTSAAFAATSRTAVAPTSLRDGWLIEAIGHVRHEDRRSGADPDRHRRAGPAQRRERARGGRRRARPGRVDRAGARRPAGLPPLDRPLARAAQPVPSRVAAGDRRFRPQRGGDLGGPRRRRGDRRPAAPGRTAPITAIIGTAGDRPDDTLRGIGRIAAQRAQRVAIKETLKYLRGRTRRSVVGELLDGVKAGGGVRGRRPDLRVGDGGPAGGDQRLGGAEAPRVIVLMCHEERDEVFELLSELGARPVDVADELTGLVPQAPGPPAPRLRSRGPRWTPRERTSVSSLSVIGTYRVPSRTPRAEGFTTR